MFVGVFIACPKTLWNVDTLKLGVQWRADSSVLMLDLETSVLSDPVDEVGHLGVDTGVASDGATVSPRHDSDLDEGVLGEEGSARVTLARVNST